MNNLPTFEQRMHDARLRLARVLTARNDQEYAALRHLERVLGDLPTYETLAVLAERAVSIARADGYERGWSEGLERAGELGAGSPVSTAGGGPVLERAGEVAGQVPPHVVDAVGRPLSDAEAAAYGLGVTDGLREAARVAGDLARARDRAVYGQEGGAR